MRIGTWNVEYAAGAEKNRQRLKQLTKAYADIWVLTETHLDLDLSKSHSNSHSSLQRPTAREGGRWVTIWSTSSYPIVERLKVVDEHRTAAAVFGTPMGDLIVFGTVLPWHSDRGERPPEAAMANWSEHHRVIEQQALEWRDLQSKYGPHTRLCVGGDLNMNLGGKHYYGTKRGRELLRTAMSKLHMTCATETKTSPPYPLENPPIDHILVPSSWDEKCRVVCAWKGRVGKEPRLSDHSGLVIEIK